jgi:CheY-like chemotaxis protein
MEAAEGRRVLRVADHPGARRAVARLLRAAGHTVTEAPTVADALRVLGGTNGDARPEVAVIDLELGHGSGVDLLAAIRGNGAAAIRVAFWTGSAHAGLLLNGSRAIGLKPDAVFTKPDDVEALLAWIERG